MVIPVSRLRFVNAWEYVQDAGRHASPSGEERKVIPVSKPRFVYARTYCTMGWRTRVDDKTAQKQISFLNMGCSSMRHTRLPSDNIVAAFRGFYLKKVGTIQKFTFRRNLYIVVKTRCTMRINTIYCGYPRDKHGILFMPESTEGISEGQTTAMSGENHWFTANFD